MTVTAEGRKQLEEIRETMANSVETTKHNIQVITTYPLTRAGVYKVLSRIFGMAHDLNEKGLGTTEENRLNLDKEPIDFIKSTAAQILYSRIDTAKETISHIDGVLAEGDTE